MADDIWPSVRFINFLNSYKMDIRLLCLERLRKRKEVRFWIRKHDMNFGEARLFLELSKAHLRMLVKNGEVPYRKSGRKARIFNKTVLNIWMVKICFEPESETERQTAEYFIKRGRIRL